MDFISLSKNLEEKKNNKKLDRNFITEHKMNGKVKPANARKDSLPLLCVD